MNRSLRCRRLALFPLLALATLVWTGCAEVYLKKLPGATPPGGVGKFEGVWKFDDIDKASEESANAKDKMFALKVADASTGRLTMSGRWKDDKPETKELFVRTLGKRTLIIFPGDETSKAKGYGFALLNHLGSSSMVLAGPNADAFARMVKAGGMRGSVELGSNGELKEVSLDDLSEEELEKLLDAPGKDGFHWEYPIVLVRSENH